MQPAGLEAVNALRARYGCAPLEWDNQCEYDAYNYAQTLAEQNGDLVHDQIPQEKAQAECLAFLYSNHNSGNYYVDGVRMWWDTQRNTAGEEVGPGEEEMYFNDPQRQYHFTNWGHFGRCCSVAAAFFIIIADYSQLSWCRRKQPRSACLLV